MARSDPFIRADRRTVLRSAGVVALAGGAAATLAACGSGTGTAASPSAAASSSAPASESPSTGSPSPSASTSPSAKASAIKPSGPSVATADVPVGGGVILGSADFVVTQPTKGTFKAFSKICTHRQCVVAEVTDGVILCKCHGSEFSITDGSVVKSPATKPLPESATTVSGSKVYVTG